MPAYKDLAMNRIVADIHDPKLDQEIRDVGCVAGALNEALMGAEIRADALFQAAGFDYREAERAVGSDRDAHLAAAFHRFQLADRLYHLCSLKESWLDCSARMNDCRAMARQVKGAA